MHILTLHQWYYGGRIIEYIIRAAPEDWVLELITAPRVLPIVIDELEEFLPSSIPQDDLLLALSESSGTATRPDYRSVTLLLFLCL
jgi:hypothetical protein